MTDALERGIAGAALDGEDRSGDLAAFVPTADMSEIYVDKVFALAARSYLKPRDVFDLHWLLKRLGQSLCQDNRTRCGACPVAALCEERRRQGRTGERANVVSVAFGGDEAKVAGNKK